MSTIVIFSAFISLASMYVRYAINVSLYEQIVFALAPRSCGKYLVRKSVKYLEKLVGFMIVII
jgi:hypothetical protein